VDYPERPVANLEGVGVVEAQADLAGYIGRDGGRQQPVQFHHLRYHRAHVAAHDVLHGDEVRVRHLAEIVDLDDVGVG